MDSSTTNRGTNRGSFFRLGLLEASVDDSSLLPVVSNREKEAFGAIGKSFGAGFVCPIVRSAREERGGVEEDPCRRQGGVSIAVLLRGEFHEIEAA